MNGFALISAFACIISITLALTIFFLNKKALLNKLFALALLINAYWAFGEFMMMQASTFETALFWDKAISFFPFFLAILLHGILIFTESDLLKSKLTYFGLYFPTLFFSIINLTTDLISVPPVPTYWGYTNTVQSGSLLGIIFIIWAGVIALLSVSLCVLYYANLSEITKKRTAKFVTISITVAVLLSVLTNQIQPILNFYVPGLTNISVSVAGIFIAFAVFRFHLYSLNPEIAADNIVSTMLDSLILADLKGRIISVNRSLVELTGFEENEIIGKSVKEMIEKRSNIDENLFENLQDELKVEGKIKNLEFKFRTKSGEEKTDVISSSIVRNKQGQEIGIAIILHDITERKKMEQKLVKAERFASIGELAGMVGHDLRNPLTGIRGAVYYLKTKHAATLDEKDKAMFETIEKSIEYSNKIINDLLEYSREINLMREKTTPKMFLANAISLVQIPENISVIDATEDKPIIQVDVNKMNRVFINLIKNAFDSMPNGGTLTIKSEDTNDRVTFSFIDTGIGMDQETLKKIWTPLFTTKAKGMGFGLAISKRIIEAHGGRITAESTVGKGTTIAFSIPMFDAMPDLVDK